MHADKPCCARWQSVPKPHEHRTAEEVCSRMCVCVRINGLCRQASLVACTSRGSWTARARYGPPGRGGAAFFPEPVSPNFRAQLCCRTRARTRGSRKEQASRALPTALNAVSELAATVSSQAGNPHMMEYKCVCIAFAVSGRTAERAACLAARASRKQLQQWPGQDAISRVRQWLCILCCRTDLGEQHPVHPEVVKDEAAGCRAHSTLCSKTHNFVDQQNFGRGKPQILLINNFPVQSIK